MHLIISEDVFQFLYENIKVTGGDGQFSVKLEAIGRIYATGLDVTVSELEFLFKEKSAINCSQFSLKPPQICHCSTTGADNTFCADLMGVLAARMKMLESLGCTSRDSNEKCEEKKKRQIIQELNKSWKAGQ